MTAPEYRTPDEQQAADEQQRRIQAVLDQAVHDGASMAVAMRLGEPAEVVEQWVNRLYTGLAEGLVDRPNEYAGDDRLAAIADLLWERMTAEADLVLAEIERAAHDITDEGTS